MLQRSSPWDTAFDIYQLYRFQGNWALGPLCSLDLKLTISRKTCFCFEPVKTCFHLNLMETPPSPQTLG